MLAVAVAGCGGDDDADIDGGGGASDAAARDAPAAIDATPGPDSEPGPDAAMAIDAAPSPDAADSPACLAFLSPATVITAYPASGSGNINAGTQLVDVTAADCATVSAPLGVGAPGREQILALTNLVAGTEYRVSILGAADLSIYIATSCSGTAGPTTGECLLYQDTLSLTETTTFTQPSFVAPVAGVAYLIVDYFSTTAPGNGNFNFSIDEVECTTSFDCPSVDAPVCDAFVCVPGPNDCLLNEDPSPPENADDGPAGATDIERDEPHAAAVCEEGTLESDFYRFVATAGEDLAIALEWNSTIADLDLIVYDAAGVEVARAAGSDRPETATLIAPATGDYFAQVFEFSGLATPTTADPYTLEVHLRECAWSGDCTDPTLPRCSETLRCVAGPSSCATDDPGSIEDADDGPVGATVVAPVLGAGPTTASGQVCSFPRGGDSLSIERDFFAVEILGGELVAFGLAWTGTDEMAFEVFDALGTVVAEPAPGVSPLSIGLSDALAGTYYVSVRKNAPITTASTPYEVSIQRSGL